jgi:PAS domain S-box-containing protein
LLARVQTHLELRRLRVKLEQQAADLRQANEQLRGELAERKRTEETLRASQQIIEGIINTIPVRVFWKDSNLVYLGCNAVFARDAGFADPKEIIGKDDYQMGWRDQAELYRGDDRQVIESGCSKLLIEEPQTTPAGNTITLLSCKIPLRGSKWEVSGVLGTYMDITERKHMEDKLRQLSRAVEQSPASIVITDPAGDIEYVNPKFVEINGFTLAEVLGKNPRVLKSGDKGPEVYRELWQTITAGKEWRGEFHNKKKNGELYWESASISPIRDPAGHITHFVAVKEDITARKQIEAERDQLIQDLQKALANVKSLSGLLPICAGCKKIRDDKGYWSQVESYVQTHSEATFTHGLCPDCIKKYYPELEEAGVGDSRQKTS